MAELKGIVERINSRQVRTKKGDQSAYSMLVKEPDGSENWYGLGFMRPTFREGSSITFTADKNARGYWDADPTSVQVSKEAATPSQGNSTGGVAALSNRDKSITLQTAFKVAPMIVDSMVKAEVLTFPKTKKEASQDLVLEMTTKIAYDLQKMFLEPDKYDPTVDEEDVEDQEYGEFDDE